MQKSFYPSLLLIILGLSSFLFTSSSFAEDVSISFRIAKGICTDEENSQSCSFDLSRVRTMTIPLKENNWDCISSQLQPKPSYTHGCFVEDIIVEGKVFKLLLDFSRSVSEENEIFYQFALRLSPDLNSSATYVTVVGDLKSIPEFIFRSGLESVSETTKVFTQINVESVTSL